MRKPFLLLLAAGLTLAACAANAAPQSGPTPGPYPTFGPSESSAASPSAPPTPADGDGIPGPRIVLATPTGIDTRDSQSGQPLSFMRRPLISALSNSGDSQYVIYTEEDQFGVFDSGLRALGKDNEIHYYGETPLLTSVFYPAPQAGHVVTNRGVTTFFSNGTGQASVIQAGFYGNSVGAMPPLQAQSPHAGFAVWVEGDFLLTQGDRSGATGVQVVRDGQPAGEVVDCPQAQPGTAGAKAFLGSVYVVGCRGAFLLYRAGELSRYTLPQSAAAAQLTDLVGSDSSPWVLARVASGAAQTTELALIDLRDASLKLLELPAAASPQTLARGRNGEGLVLTSDGQLQIIDPERAAIVEQIPVFPTSTGAQLPDAPIVQVRRDLAFLLSPLRDEVVVLDIPTRAIKNRFAVAEEITDMEVVDPVDIASMPVFE